MLTKTEENYIKTIYHFQTDDSKTVSTNIIAEKLNTKASSVTDMIQKLADKKVIHYKKYQGVSLTKKGKDIAIDIIRKHRLWEVFLYNNLGYGWDEVHYLAEQLEHIKSDTLANKLDAYLEFPTFDPHGHPIPDKEGNITPLKNRTLSFLQAQQKCVVTGVNDSSSDFLKYLSKINIHLGTVIEVISIENFDNSMLIKIEKQELQISQQISKNLYVKQC